MAETTITNTRRSLRLLTAEKNNNQTASTAATLKSEDNTQQQSLSSYFLTSTVRSAKARAIEAISEQSIQRRCQRSQTVQSNLQVPSESTISHSTSRKRTRSKQTPPPSLVRQHSPSSPSSVHNVLSTSLKQQKRKRSRKDTKQEEQNFNTKLKSTQKRQRPTSSSSVSDHSPSPSHNRRSLKKQISTQNRKRSKTTTPILTSKRIQPQRSSSSSDTEQAETGNICIRSRSGREIPTIVSDPVVPSYRRRRNRSSIVKTSLDTTSTTQTSSQSPSGGPHSGQGTTAAGYSAACASSNNHIHSSSPSSSTTSPTLYLFNPTTPYYYPYASTATTNSSTSQSPSIYTYSSGTTRTPIVVVPNTASSVVAGASTTLQQQHMSESEGESDLMDRHSIDPTLARVVSSSRGADLLGSLNQRLNQMITRVNGNSSMGRLPQYIQHLQSNDNDLKLATLNDLCQLLVMSNEETLPQFPYKQLVPLLIHCLSDENELNMEIAHHACRALCYLMEALPRATVCVVEGTSVFLNKIRSISCIDIAEQSLIALEMISRRNGKHILINNGIGACLQHIEFFSMTSQNKALAIVANCCYHIITRQDFNYIKEHLENLSNRLRSEDKKSIDHVCNIFSRLVENFHKDQALLREIASTQLLKMMQTMLVLQPPVLTGSTFVSIVHTLYLFCAFCPLLAVTLLKMNIAETLICLLTGTVDSGTPKKPFTYKSSLPSSPTDTTPSSPSTAMPSLHQSVGVELISRTPQELYEIVSLIGEMMPKLPDDEPLFQVDQLLKRGLLRNDPVATLNAHDHVLWQWQDDRGQLHPYSIQDSRIIEQAWQQEEEEISLSTMGRSYTIDFTVMQQINEETGTQRFIQRKVNPLATPAESSQQGDQHTADQPQQPDSPSSNETPPTTNRSVTTTTTTTTVDLSLMDARTEMMKDNIDLYSQFIQCLFTILYEVYNSSAGPAVKHRCLQALLRMIYFSPSSLLEIILKQQSISSHIASMLASSDLKIVINALQMAEILMKKLPNIFSIYFHREGVVHQIEILIDFGVAATSSNQSSSTAVNNNDIVQIQSTNSAASLPQIDPTFLSAFNNPTTILQIPNIAATSVVTPINEMPLDEQLQLMPAQAQQQNRTTITSTNQPQSGRYSTSSYRGLGRRAYHQQQQQVAADLLLNSSSTTVLEAQPSTSHRPNTRNRGRGQPSQHGVSGRAVNYKTPSRSMFDDVTTVDTRTQKPSSSRHATASSSTGTLDLGNSRSYGRGHSRPSLRTPVLPNPSFGTSATSNFNYAIRPVIQRTSAIVDQHFPPTYYLPPARPIIPTETSLHTSTSSQSPAMSSPLYVPPTLSSQYLQQQFAYATGIPLSGIHQHPNYHHPQPSSVLTNNEKAKWKEWIQQQAKTFRQTYFSSHQSNDSALTVITRLGKAVDQISVTATTTTNDENMLALKEISSIIANGDVSPFEMVHSGLIIKLFQFLFDNTPQTYERQQRLKEFLNVLFDLPLQNSCDISSSESFLKTFIIDLYHTQFSANNNVTASQRKHSIRGEQRNDTGEHNIFYHLVNKLHGCINQLEQFPIRVHDIPGTSTIRNPALKFLTSHQLKCNLVRHQDCKTLKQWNSGPVKIDPLALVSAIERYLLLRGIASGNTDDTGGTMDDEESEVSNESDAEDVINVLTRSTTLRLEFLINERIIPHNMTIYQAIKLYSMTPDSETETDSESVLTSNIWSKVHTISYRQASSSPLSTTTTSMTATTTVAASISPASAISNATGSAASITALTTYSPRSGGQTKANSKKTSKTAISGAQNLSKRSSVDELWINGLCPKAKSLLTLTLNESMPTTLTVNDSSLNAIFLLRILNGLNLYWYDLYHDTSTMVIMNNNNNINASSYLTLIPKTEFLSIKLSSKVNRQLQDPLVIMTGNVPAWVTEIGYTCPFLFPFETRQMLFYVTAFDRDRAMQRLLDSSDMMNQQHNDQNERSSVAPRIERKKVQLSRANILAETEKIFASWNNKAYLEVQYEDEVGFGLGPTLECYSMVSKELQKNNLELWRSDKMFESSHDASSSSTYVDTTDGLYPAPFGRNAKSTSITKVRQKFKFLGKFMAKALMDSRMIDMPFSIVFYKWMLAQEDSLNIEDLIHVDTNLYQQFKKLENIVHQRDKLQQMSKGKKRLKSKDDPIHNNNNTSSNFIDTVVNDNDDSLKLDGCSIDDLGLCFTLPGFNHIELKKGGRDCSVNLSNLDQYINLVVYWTLVEGVRRQFESFRDGFNSIFPIHHLKCFYPDELHQVFCGSGATDLWDLKVLLESTRCDHGYNLNSRAVKWLFEIMIDFDIDERRAFLQFVTGSPRLPVGGFRTLHPPLTVVRKTVENENPDNFLPSVMTCVNYLKLPDYTSKDIMKTKLSTAIHDGQFAFLLS